MGLINWSWLKKESLHKRRQSAPPMPAINYDPNANREQYLQAFDEFKQRASLYNQPTISEENEETGSQSDNATTNKASNENDNVNYQAQSCKTKQCSLPNKMSRSIFNGSHKKTNTPNSTSVIAENNNSIFVNEVLEFEGNCINDASFGATGQSPPRTFYRNNSNPFSPEKNKSEPSSARKTQNPLKESRQRACEKLLRYVRPTPVLPNSSNSSGAYKQYDLDSILPDDDERTTKKSNGQDIPIDVYEKIVNVFGNAVQHKDSYDGSGKHNSPLKPTIENGISGISPLSAFTSFQRCEGLVDENFGFLNDTQWREYLMDESESYVNDERKRENVKVTDLDKSSVSLSQYGESGSERENNEALSETDPAEQRSQDIDSTMSPQADEKHPIYIIECKAKDIKPKSSALRNTIVTPLDFSSGSFRKTTVTLKKCCPRDTASIRLVEEAIERDFEILSKVKHPNIMILMAACFHRKLINHMTLVLEPVDFTLNYYLHQLDRSFSVMESVSIVQQISSAALYLQECGYIHSNISSHNVLVRERPLCVKLSSFELATDVDCSAIRAEVEINYPQCCTSKLGDTSRTQQTPGPEGDTVSLKEQYKEMSKRPPAPKRSPNAEQEYMNIPSKYLIYDTIYRQRLSLHNFSAPELLTTDQRFVFPTPRTDVYSLCLLLWEMLNQCVPFAVYSRLDMERMITNNKLNLPFFERERCYYFMDIFRVGLAVNLEHRSIDLPHLIEMLEDVELEILTGGDDMPGESSYYDEEDVEHYYENFPQQAQTDEDDDTTISSISNESLKLSGNNVNSFSDFVLSPSSLGFDKSLKDGERTSTKKMRKKPPHKYVQHQIRELFPAVKEVAEGEALKDKEESSFVDLNENFREISDDIRRHVFEDISEDEKLNENLAVIADDIRRKILNDTKDGASTKYQPMKVYREINEPSTMQKNRKTPTVVGFSIKSKKLNDSKTFGNVLETPVPTINAAKKLFNFSSSGNDAIEGHDAMPKTPIARQNYIRRSAWLSNQQPTSSNNGYERMTNGKNTETGTVDDEKKVNVSVRIVHNKITPKKATVVTEIKPTTDVDEGRPSILSKIKFFNSANETTKTDVPFANGKHPANVPLKADEVVTRDRSANYSNKMVNERFVTEAAGEYECQDNGTNGRKSVINELTDVMYSLQKSPLDQPQRKQLFENKLWKRELDICNRSLNSSDGGNGSKVVAPKFRSVRDTILKFEKRSEVTRSMSSSNESPTELVGNVPKATSTSKENHSQRKPGDSPTLIKRTIYSERILSGVDLSSLDNQVPIFDNYNFGSQKVATRVSVRQVRQTSSDVGVTNRRQMSGKIDVRHTICGSEIELLTFNAGTFNASAPSSAVTKYVCFNCASKMTSDELKALTYAPINTSMDSDVNELEDSPRRRCQARVKIQDTRSIEDLYIDDDFVHGLGANMELQSDSSDLLDFDMISSGLFNSKYDAEHNFGN